jgi:hypothetical protein
MYINPATDTFYLEEAYQRMLYYPPPYYGYYTPPWLWCDGDKHGGYEYWLWESFILTRMSEPAPVTISMWGDYTPATGAGTIYAQFRNDSSSTINGRVILVITEDSIYYEAPNDVDWHNHVPKDYLPDHNGQVVSIQAGDSVIVSQAFTIEPSWNVNQCKILTWIQDDNMQVDSTKEIWQGGMVRVTELGIAETGNDKAIPAAHVAPNPCTDGTYFVLTQLQSPHYSLTIYDALGRQVRRICDKGTGKEKSVYWNCTNDQNNQVQKGVYFYRYVSGQFSQTGKVVVR